MKSYILKKYGSPNVLNIENSPEPVPGSGELRIKIGKIGLNYAEVQSRKGLYGWSPKLPYILSSMEFLVLGIMKMLIFICYSSVIIK